MGIYPRVKLTSLTQSLSEVVVLLVDKPVQEKPEFVEAKVEQLQQRDSNQSQAGDDTHSLARLVPVQHVGVDDVGGLVRRPEDEAEDDVGTAIGHWVHGVH